MKRALMLTLAVLAAMPLLGDEPAKPADQTAATSTAPPADQPPPAQDSPLVQAAKRSGRLGHKPKKVITNATLKASKGHVTTTTIQHSVEIPEPEPSESEKQARAAAAKAAEDKKVKTIGTAEAKKAEDEATARRARAAAAAEEGMLEEVDDDPARAEHEADTTAAEKPPHR